MKSVAEANWDYVMRVLIEETISIVFSKRIVKHSFTTITKIEIVQTGKLLKLFTPELNFLDVFWRRENFIVIFLNCFLPQKQIDKGLYNGKRSKMNNFKEQAREAYVFIPSIQTLNKKCKNLASLVALRPSYPSHSLPVAGSTEIHWLKIAVSGVRLNNSASSQFPSPRKRKYSRVAVRILNQIYFL